MSPPAEYSYSTPLVTRISIGWDDFYISNSLIIRGSIGWYSRDRIIAELEYRMPAGQGVFYAPDASSKPNMRAATFTAHPLSGAVASAPTSLQSSAEMMNGAPPTIITGAGSIFSCIDLMASCIQRTAGWVVADSTTRSGLSRAISPTSESTGRLAPRYRVSHPSASKKSDTMRSPIS
jgi:hypothetical protein